MDVPAARARLGLTGEYQGIAGIESLKVAVLDSGFEGVGAGRAWLPESAEVVEHYDPEFVRRFGLGDPEYRKPLDPGNRHGRAMAQIVWAIAGGSPRGPKFLLLNANGPTLFRRAVRLAIERKADVILFSGSFEGGGNGDGRGPIDRAVAERPGGRTSPGSTPRETTASASTTARSASSPTASSASATGRTSPRCGSATAWTTTP